MKVLWLLDELGLAFERIDAGLQFGRNDTDDYLAMNPFGLVPVLCDDAVVVFESNAILRYICQAHAPASPLYPRDPAGRARVEAWMDAQLAKTGPLGIVFQNLVRLPPEQRDEAAITVGLRQSAELFDVLDSHLSRQPFLAGEALTLADIAFGPAVHRWFALPIARPDLPALRAYYRRLTARAAYVARCAGKLS